MASSHRLLAVEHGMGTRETALEMVDYIVEIFTTNDNISSEEIADVLSETMDNLFQTICEDNSPDEVGALLLKFFQYCKGGQEDKAVELLSKLPACQLWLSKPILQTSFSKPDSSQPSNQQNVQVMDAEENEWTEVKSRRSARTRNADILQEDELMTS